MASRRSTSSTPPLSPSATRATTPPLGNSGFLTPCDDAAATTHASPPPSGDSSGRQPLARENSEMHRLDLKAILSEAMKCAQTLKTGEVSDTEFERIAMEFLNELYSHLPKDLQAKLIAELKAKVPPLLLEADTMPMNILSDDKKDFPKANGISIKELMGWTIQKIVLPAGLGFLMFLITRYVTKAYNSERYTCKS